jgi:BlaI family transcriptional regulator, penicillinase repressor
MKELTKAEDQIMQILWTLEKGFVKDIVEQMPEPKPSLQHRVYHCAHP